MCFGVYADIESFGFLESNSKDILTGIAMKKQEANQNAGVDTSSVSKAYFIKIAGITSLGMPFANLNDLKAQGVSIVSDQPILSLHLFAFLWAVKELEEALTLQGVAVKRFTKLSQAPTGSLCIIAGASNASTSVQLLKEAKTSIPAVPEALGLGSCKVSRKTGTISGWT